MLRGGITQAYMAGSDAKQPELSFEMVPHEDVQVVGARISLAETMLVLDANGAYRAAAAFRMNNATEQFLDVELPEGAQLWTAVVADEPVKPIRGRKAAGSRRVSIPLVKTASGDLDYAVTLKYGGKTDALGRIGSVNFPLIHTKNIRVERSVVQLHLPEDYRWLHFGGTMHPGAEATVTAAVLSYQTDQIERLMEAARQADPFAQERAKNNMKQFGLAVAAYREHFGSYIGRDAEAQKEAQINDDVRKTAAGLLEQADNAAAQGAKQEAGDTSENLPALQNATRARNVVNNMDLNWKAGLQDGDKDVAASPSARTTQPEGRFNREWFANNDLAGNSTNIMPTMVNVEKAPAATGPGVQPPQGNAGFGWRAGHGSGKGHQANKAFAGANQPANPGFSQSLAEEKPAAPPIDSFANTSGKSSGQQQEVRQYQQKLQQQANLGGAKNAIGVNSYSGATNINAGTMLLSGGNTHNGGTAVNGASNNGLGAVITGKLGTEVRILDGTPAKSGDNTIYFDTYAGLSMKGSTADKSSTNKALTDVARDGNNPAPASGPHSLLETMNGSGKTTESGEVGISKGATAPAVQPAGLASLDFQLPEGGQVYYFSAPRGEIEITAQAVSDGFLAKLAYLAAALAAVIVLASLLRAIHRGGMRWWGSPLAAALMLCLGAVSMVFCVLPVLGAILFLVGVALLIHRAWARARAKQAIPAAATAQ
jgi:hypothetical protein